MTQYEQTLMKRYIAEAAKYGIEATDGNAESLEFFDYALSFLRRKQEWWVNEGAKSWSLEFRQRHIKILTLCIEDTVRGRQIFTNDIFLRWMAAPTKEGHALDRR